jgi:hypothetical protein
VTITNQVPERKMSLNEFILGRRIEEPEEVRVHKERTRQAL